MRNVQQEIRMKNENIARCKSAASNIATVKKKQYAKSAKEEECKTKTLESVKVQHVIVQYIKRVQHEKKCNMKKLLHKKVQHGNGVV